MALPGPVSVGVRCGTASLKRPTKRAPPGRGGHKRPARETRTWSTFSAVISRTSRAGGLRSTPSGPECRDDPDPGCGKELHSGGRPTSSHANQKDKNYIIKASQSTVQSAKGKAGDAEREIFSNTKVQTTLTLTRFVVVMLSTKGQSCVCRQPNL